MMHAAYADLFAEEVPQRHPKLQNVFEKSKRDFWNETTAVDWNSELSLSDDKRAALARILSIIYYGERAAVTVCSQLCATVPDEEAKLALAAQVMEEAKHVAVFQRLLTKLDAISPPSNFAKWLLKDIIETNDIAAKMIGMHLFVENIATHLFRALRENVDEPLVQEVLEYVAKDEAKHTAIGVLYLPTLLEKTNPAKRLWLLGKQAKWLTFGMGMVKDGYKDAQILDIDLAVAGQRALRDHYKLRAQLKGTRGLLDVPGFDKVIDTVGRWTKK
ncbi:MAG: ferritin-like domain-containing protein [Deltaproteobacteria bacterium]|nr:ferritin-like domain-containing protein [Deltaproteobacteria bacterium]